MAEEHKCGKCGRSFDSKRGLSVHQSQKHEDEETGKEIATEDRRLDISLGIRQTALLSFVLGIGTGMILISLAPITVEFIDDLMTQEENWEDIVDLEDRPFLGDEDAEVTIVSYEDFFCPFCTAFHNENFASANGMNSAFSDIKENYIDEGEVKYYFNYYPGSIGYEVSVAHEAVLEHGSEEAYWEFHEMHFDNFETFSQLYQQSPENYRETIKEEVQEMEVESEEFESTFDSNINEIEHILPPNPRPESPEEVFSNLLQQEDPDKEINQRLLKQMQEGSQLGVEATPTIIIEGEIVRGAQPYRAFETVIEQHLD